MAKALCDPPGRDPSPPAQPLGEFSPDSEGLTLWTDETKLFTLLGRASSRYPHVYWAQVAHIPSEASLERLERGIMLDHQKTAPFRAWVLPIDPDVPPIAGKAPNRPGVPWCWIGLTVVRESDRQIRKVLDAVGHSACRLVRVQIGTLTLGDLPCGQWRELTPTERTQLLGENNVLPSPWRYQRFRRIQPRMSQ